MEANPVTSGSGQAPPSSSSTPATAATTTTASSTFADQAPRPPSRYEAQKRRDWNTFQQYLRNHKPPLSPSRCGGAHVIEFLRYLDQFGKTRVHHTGCPFFGRPDPPAPCGCPLRQAWGSLDALVGRLRAAFEESGGGPPESSPFAARAVRAYLREVRDGQARARGLPYDKNKKKKRKRPPPASGGDPGASASSSAAGGAGAAGSAPAEEGSDAPPGTVSAS